jgi:hypothetical protein
MDRKSYFSEIDPALPPAEQAARAKRQRHAEWGIAIARLGGTEPTPSLLQELQQYIDGEVGLDVLSQESIAAGPAQQVLQAVAQREQFAG